MAIFHLSVKPVSRGSGRTSTAAAAYRSASIIRDERTGETHDYRRKSGVVYSAIMTPDGSTIARGDLWNLAEASERRKDSRTAREYEIALPAELDQEGRQNLAEELQEQTKNFISQAQTVLDELSSAAKKPVERATKELDKSIKKVEDDFSSTGMKFILVIGISILFIFLTCVFSFKYLLNGYMNDLAEIKYNIKTHQETLEKIQSETWDIKLITYNDGSRGIKLPKGMKISRTGEDKKGHWHIIIEK